MGDVKYAILENKDEWPMPLILHLSRPLLIGQVVQCDSEEMVERVKRESFKRGGGAELRGYRIVIVAAGCLDNSLNEMEKSRSTAEKLASIYKGMADFYLDYRISRSPRMYEKYKRKKSYEDYRKDNVDR